MKVWGGGLRSAASLVGGWCACQLFFPGVAFGGALVDAVGSSAGGPSHEALRTSKDSALSGNCDHPEEITVGYQQGLPIGEAEANTRARRILARAFPPPCNILSFRELHRSDVASAVVDERISLGLIAVPPPQQTAVGHYESPVIEKEDVSGVSSLPILPPSYSVVTHAGSQQEARRTSRYSSWAWGVLCALLGALVMTLCVWVLNLRLPRPWLWREQAVQRLDVRLGAPQRVWGWVFSSVSGGILGLLWAMLGVGLYLIWPRAAPAMQRETKLADFEGAVRAAYPGRTIQEYRNGIWVRCAQPHECMNNFRSEKSIALAGDRELLCFYAKTTGIGGLRFDPDLSAVPMLQVFLLPASSEQSPSARHSRAALLEAMRDETGELSPWSTCLSEGGGAAP